MGTIAAVSTTAPLATACTPPPLPLATACTPPPLPPGVGASAPSTTSTVLGNVALFGSIGAAVGFGAAFLGLPIVGAVAAPIAAAIGGAIGATIGLFVGLAKAENNASRFALPPVQAFEGQTVLASAEPAAPVVTAPAAVVTSPAAVVTSPAPVVSAPQARDTVRDQVLASFDRNKDGSITLASEVDSTVALSHVASAADMNGDGTVNREELNDTLLNADTDKDGKLSSAELGALGEVAPSATDTSAKTAATAPSGDATTPPPSGDATTPPPAAAADDASTPPSSAPPVPTSLPGDTA